MKMTTGFLKLHRSILDKEFYKKPVARALFVHLLLTVNIKESTFNGVRIPVGARVSSLPKLSDELGFSEKQIRAGLGALKKAGCVSVTRHSKFSVIVVENWSKYQSVGQSKGQSVLNTEGQQNKKILSKENKREGDSIEFEEALEAFRHNQ